MQVPLSAYPYFERRHHPSEPRLSEAAAAQIAAVSGPIVEIAGPTPQGFRLLGDRAVLPSRPTITNARSPLNFFADPEVDAFVDGTDMPYEDSSVGMFLASHLATPDMFKRLRIGRGAKSQKFWDREADAEYARFHSDPEFRPYYNLRISVLSEMTRTLDDGGLILFEGLRQQDAEVAEALGHTVLQQETFHGVTVVYDCVFQKSV